MDKWEQGGQTRINMDQIRMNGHIRTKVNIWTE